MLLYIIDFLRFQELLTLAKKRKKQDVSGDQVGSNSSDSESEWDSNDKSTTKDAPKKKKTMKKVSTRSSDESSEESDSDSDSDSGDSSNDEDIEKCPAKKSPTPDKLISPTSPPKSKTRVESEHEEGEVSDSSVSSKSLGSESSSNSEFDDGFDENYYGDEEDRARLNALSEKERETEIYKRIERRDMMRTRWEIERKLKQQRRGEKGPKGTMSRKVKKPKLKEKQVKLDKKIDIKLPTQVVPIVHPPETISNEISLQSGKESFEDVGERGQIQEYFDHKERSKERKKNVEMNRTDDKRSNAMALLKAKREGKAKRGKFYPKKKNCLVEDLHVRSKDTFLTTSAFHTSIAFMI